MPKKRVRKSTSASQDNTGTYALSLYESTSAWRTDIDGFAGMPKELVAHIFEIVIYSCIESSPINPLVDATPAPALQHTKSIQSLPRVCHSWRYLCRQLKLDWTRNVDKRSRQLSRADLSHICRYYPRTVALDLSSQSPSEPTTALLNMLTLLTGLRCLTTPLAVPYVPFARMAPLLSGLEALNLMDITWQSLACLTHFGRLTRLQLVALSEWPRGASQLRHISQVTGLRELTLGRLPLSAVAAQCFSGLHQLTALRLLHRSLDLHNDSLAAFAASPVWSRLAMLSVRGTGAQAAELASLLNPSACRVLKLGAGARLSSLEPLARLSELEVLCLRNQPLVSNAVLARAGSLLPRLKTLRLKNCLRITDASLASLAEHPSLQQLDVLWCPHLSDAGFDALRAAGFVQTESRRYVRHINKK